MRLLRTVASGMGVAIENARLFAETQRLLKETEQRAAELAVINSIQQGIAAELDFQAHRRPRRRQAARGASALPIDRHRVAVTSRAELMHFLYAFALGKRAALAAGAAGVARRATPRSLRRASRVVDRNEYLPRWLRGRAR